MYRILISGMSPNLAGTETFIMTYYRALDKTKFKVDFVVRTTEKIVFEDEILANGSKIYRIPSKTKNISQYKQAMTDFFENNGKYYDAIWMNFMGVHNIDFLKYAKKYGIKRRIIHSHTSDWKRGPLITVLNKINKRLLKFYGTDFFACSEEAADYMFKGSIRSRAIVIKNAIDAEKFAYSQSKGAEIRKKLGWEDKTIIGSIGRLAAQKNHPFLIDVLNIALKKNEDLRLIIIGEAADGNATLPLIQEKIKEYNLQDKVYLAGKQTELQNWLSAFDVFTLPSIFEGLGIVNIEAQANGLPCVVSSVVPNIAKINEKFIYLDVNKDDSAKQWADGILELSKFNREEEKVVTANVNNAGYNIKQEIKKLEKILLGE